MAHAQDTTGLYIKVLLALFLLTALTVAVSYVDLGPLNIPMALAIAISKAVCVIIFFMHLRHSNALTRLFVIGGFVWLIVLFTFTLCDYLTRSWENVHDSSSWVKKSANYYSDNQH